MTCADDLTGNESGLRHRYPRNVLYPRGHVALEDVDGIVERGHDIGFDFWATPSRIMRKIALITTTLAALGMLTCGLVGLVHPLNPSWKLSEVSFIRATFEGGYVQLAASLPIDGTAGAKGADLAELDLDIKLRVLGARIGPDAFTEFGALVPRRDAIRLPGLVAWTNTVPSLATFDWSNAKTLSIEPTGTSGGQTVRFAVVVTPFWIPPTFLAAYPIFALIRGPLRRWRRRRRGLCLNCGYNLEGNMSGVCPECGDPR